MATASTRCPFQFSVAFHVNCKDFPSKLDFSRSNFPSHGEISRFNLFSASPAASTSTSKEYIGRICSLPGDNDFFGEKPPTPMLDMIENPIHLKNLSIEELKQLADEIRAELSFVMSKTQKQWRSSLSVVELTIAIHRVFNAPVDKILWDAGDQAYVHKILTGRRSLMHTIRQKNGLSGSTSRFESEFDPFGAAHGCNSVSAGLGMAIARDIKGKRDRVVVVIDNQTTLNGQIYEAMCNAGYLDSNMVVILNDSRHSLQLKVEEGPKAPINALSSTLSKLQSSKSFRKFREGAKGLTKRFGRGTHEWAAKVDEFVRGMVSPPGSTLFEEMGLYYIGPVDGHNIDDLLCVLNGVASLDSMGPVLVHVMTKDEQDVEHDEKVKKDNEGANDDSESFSCSISPRTYTDCLVEALMLEAERDKDIVIVHAGMGIEAPFELFQQRYPDRFFNVWMAEQHAVTFSAGLSCGGLKPFCVIPSAFLQRAYDQPWI